MIPQAAHQVIHGGSILLGEAPEELDTVVEAILTGVPLIKRVAGDRVELDAQIEVGSAHPPASARPAVTRARMAARSTGAEMVVWSRAAERGPLMTCAESTSPRRWDCRT